MQKPARREQLIYNPFSVDLSGRGPMSNGILEHWRGLPYCIAVLFSGSVWLSVSAQPQSGIAGVAWLSGCWHGTLGQSALDEHWMAPRGGTMLGMSRTVRAGKTTSYELVLLKEQDGRLAYEAHPSGQASAVFLSREAGDAVVIFENLQHDFPQRIGYRRSGTDALAAWIEGSDKGQPRRIDYAFRRVACK
jgi:hypothetical protein